MPRATSLGNHRTDRRPPHVYGYCQIPWVENHESDWDSYTIERGILMERRVSSRWVQGTAVQAVDRCENFDAHYPWKAPIRIDPHATLDVVPWDGFLCGGQCPAACMQNTKVTSGILRFVVVFQGGKRILSPEFSISADSKSWKDEPAHQAERKVCTLPANKM
jgi:hypothetical protein